MAEWMDEIERLAELRDKGLLSDEEFEVKRQEIINVSSKEEILEVEEVVDKKPEPASDKPTSEFKSSESVDKEFGYDLKTNSSSGIITPKKKSNPKGLLISLLVVVVGVIIGVVVSQGGDSSEGNSALATNETVSKVENTSSSSSNASSNESQGQANGTSQTPCIFSDTSRAWEGVRDYVAYALFVDTKQGQMLLSHGYSLMHYEADFVPSQSEAYYEIFMLSIANSPEFYTSWFADVGNDQADNLAAAGEWAETLEKTPAESLCKPATKTPLTEIYKGIDLLSRKAEAYVQHAEKHANGTYNFDTQIPTYELQISLEIIEQAKPLLQSGICGLQRLTPNVNLLEGSANELTTPKANASRLGINC